MVWHCEKKIPYRKARMYLTQFARKKPQILQLPSYGIKSPLSKLWN